MYLLFLANKMYFKNIQVPNTYFKFSWENCAEQIPSKIRMCGGFFASQNLTLKCFDNMFSLIVNNHGIVTCCGLQSIIHHAGMQTTQDGN